MFKDQIVKDANRAVEICLDVVKTLNARRYTCGTYGEVDVSYEALEGVKDLQQLMPYIEETCQVCLKGSLLLSKAKLFDEVEVDDMCLVDNFNGTKSLEFGNRHIHRQLSPIFDEFTLDLMENAFERRTINDQADEYEEEDDGILTDDAIEARLRGAALFGRQYNSKLERVRAVMENVITNHGIFVVEPYYGLLEYSPRLDNDGDGVPSPPPPMHELPDSLIPQPAM